MTSDPTLPFALPVRPQVTRIRQRMLTDLVKGPPARTQPLSGYDAHYGDIVDYIVRITEEIWRDRVVDRIYETYDPGCVVHGASYIMRTAREVVTATLATLVSYPDGVTDHVNIAWRGDETEGFYTSHLGYSKGTNLGASEFGPASGKRVMSYFVADCISKNNLIHTEWLMHDSGAVLHYLGLNLRETAQKMAADTRIKGFVVSPSVPTDTKTTHQLYNGPNDTPDGWALHHFDAVWNGRQHGHVPFHFAADAIAHWPGCRDAVGHDAIGKLIKSLLSSLPDATTRVEHVSWSEETDGVILAVRWLIHGTTQTGGIFGDIPGGKKIAFWGSSHFRFGNGRVVEEWTVFDELDALIQAYRS
jgi:predicted ester cyclase